MFDTRQLATIILLVAFFGWALTRRDIRESIGALAKISVHLKILIPFLLYGGWLVGLHWLARQVGLWNSRLLGESLFWAVASGFALLLLSATDASKQDNFFRTRIVEAVKFGTFFEFFVNIKSFNLLGELIFLPVLVLLVGVRTVAAHDETQPIVRKLMDGLLAFVSLSLLIYTVTYLVQDWSQIDKGQELRKLLMPIWLTLGAMPFAFVFALITVYGRVFNNMRTGNESKRPALRARLGVVVALRSRLLDIGGFAGRHAWQAGQARTVREAAEAVWSFRAERDGRLSKERARLARLEALAGVEGTDLEGRQLDRREFDETKKALQWIATCHMGHYSNDGRYRPDLMTILGDFTRQGLPEAHGIVMKVRKGGKAWYAYRRTVTGWVLGIGANKGTPDQWFYDGPELPTSYPRPGHGWGEMAHADTVNWK
jgi:hypothetical protein